MMVDFDIVNIEESESVVRESSFRFLMNLENFLHVGET
jgi:hypothetical protein